MLAVPVRFGRSELSGEYACPVFTWCRVVVFVFVSRLCGALVEVRCRVVKLWVRQLVCGCW